MTDEDLQCWGDPDFGATPWAALARDGGAAVAWRAALAGRPAEALAQIGGMWAVAWTAEDGRVLLAVDRFARHNLCWRLQDGQLRHAPRADTLADAQTPVAAQAVYDYLFFHAIPAPDTVFAGIHRLPAGHWLQFQDGRAEVAPYWVPRFADHREEPLQALKDEFMALVQQGVARQLGASPPACYLSGGTDSSTIAGMVQRITGRGAQAYSIGFEAQGYDEMAYARIAAKAFGADHRAYYVTPDDLVRSIPTVAAHFDQPFGNSSALPAFLCAQRAQQDGVAKLLAGDGGDELFGGNARYAKQRLFGAYQLLPGPLRHQMLEPLLDSRAGRLPLLRKVASYAQQARVPMPERLNMYNLLLRLGTHDVLTPGFLAQIDIGAPVRLQKSVWDLADTGSELNRTLAFDWRFTLADSDLPKVVMSAELAQVAVGFPLLDTDLLNFSLRLAPGLKLRGQKLRWFFKEALRGFLPDAILTKSKHGFGLPFGVWAIQHPALQAMSVDALNSLAQRGIVQPDFITALTRQHVHAHPGYYGEMIWILMMLEQWLQHHAPDTRW
ncbi:MAG: asparagine synthase-related protein [Aquabacterium sp.]|nr:asparagine synthase-related protein [Aquabacterium sp.]